MQDYWHPNGESSPTHASLNHHAAEAEFLYRMADAVNEDSYAVLADRMVRGIEQSELLWYKPDGDLNYSYKPDGTCSGECGCIQRGGMQPGTVRKIRRSPVCCRSS